MEDETLDSTTSAILQTVLQDHNSGAASDDEDTDDAFTPDEVLEARRYATKPNISWLKPAVETTPEGAKFLPVKGGYLVMERVNCLLEDKPWLDTKVYRLLTDPLPDGNVRLLDCSEQHNALLNWKTAVQYGFDLRIPPPGRNPELLFESGGKRRRKKKFVEAAVKADEDKAAQLDQPKRKRGRPKGSKNKQR